MKDLLTWLSRRRFPYQPLITVEISRSRLLHNLDEFRRLANARSGEGKPFERAGIAPVLKSNAYGHGLFEVAEILEKGLARIPFFVVDSYFEAVALRSKGFKTPLLIIGYTRPETIAHSRLQETAFTISSMDILRRFSAEPPGVPESDGEEVQSPQHIVCSHPIRIHLKIDTGMRRQGILPEEAAEAISIISGNSDLILEGICTHFSDADDPENPFTESQIAVWNRLAVQFSKTFPRIRYFHAAASAGARFSAELHANVIRLGIGLYGLTDGSSFVPPLDLRPVMEMRTILTGVKKLKSGESVGYGNTFTAPTEMTIATVPAGYFEGVDRRLSSDPGGAPRGWILVGAPAGERVPCPIIGRVSMNISVIDVSRVPKAVEGMTAVVISRELADANSIAAIAAACGTITYEIAVHVPAHLKREVVD